MKTSAAENMRKLRKNRLAQHKCTRCGKPIDVNSGRTICNACKDYIVRYKKAKHLKSKKYVFVYKNSKVRNLILYDALQEAKMSTLELAKILKISQRQVQKYIFSTIKPNKKRQQQINKIFNRKIYQNKQK